MKATLALSAAAHVLFFAAVIGPSFQGRSLSGNDIMSVSLVGGGGGPGPKAASQMAAPAAKEPEPAKEPEQSKMSYKAAAKKDKPKPSSTKPKTKPAAGDKTSGSKTSGTTTTKSGPGTGTGTGSGPGGPGSGTLTVDADFKFAYYLEAIRERIGYNWAAPALMGSPGEVVATVFFKIARDGTIDDAEVEKTSNHEIFDRAALRAVKLADPLPPLPAGFKGKWLGVHFEFEHNPG